VFLDLRILNELRGYFSEVRILQGLRLEWHLPGGRQRRRGMCQAFELIIEVTRRRIACW